MIKRSAFGMRSGPSADRAGRLAGPQARTKLRVNGIFAPPQLAGRSALTGDGRGVMGAAGPAADLGSEPDQRVVLAPGHAFLHRDERIVGDLDVLRADLGAALGDVAVTESEI